MISTIKSSSQNSHHGRLSLALAALLLGLNPPVEDLIHNTHVERLLRAHKVVSFHELLNLLERHLLLPGQMPLVDLVQLLAHAQNLLRVDGDVACLAEVAARGLVHHDRGVGETVAFARVATAEEEGAHGGCLADADRADGGGDVSHCVVDGEAWKCTLAVREQAGEK